MTPQPPTERLERKNLTPEERERALALMYSVATNMKLPPKEYERVATALDCSERSIRRLWKKAYDAVKDGKLCALESGRKGRSGRKSRVAAGFPRELAEKIALTPLHLRTNIRTLSEQLCIPKTSLHLHLRSGLFRSHLARVKPCLSDAQHVARMKFALEFVKPSPRGRYEFDSLLDYIHVDEKWFFLRKESTHYCLAPNEPPPHVTVQNKNFMVKAMFLVAIARPRWVAAHQEVWDGKIGTWPFVVYEPVKRKSKNREAGMLELKTYTVDRDIYRACLVHSVIPEIKRLWPSGKRVRIQHGNAKPHVLLNDSVVVDSCAEDGWDMTLTAQPANSPDYTCLDLGFFASLQTLQNRKNSRTIEELVENVDEAFKELSSDKIDRVFMTLQSVFEASLKVDGENCYQIPHKNKNALLLTGKHGLLPLTLPCDAAVHDTAKATLSSVDASNFATNRT